MKQELDLIRAGRSEPIDRGSGPLPTAPTRKAIRESTDEIMFGALQKGSMPELVRSVCETMLVVARAVDEHDFEPGADDFVAASMSLIEAGRNALDLALMVDDKEGCRAGAVMIELTVRGICAALSIDYDKALRAVLEGREPPLPTTTKTGAPDGSDHGDDKNGPAGETERDS